MALVDLMIRNISRNRVASEKREDLRPGILVPVNSSTSAFNSLEYALQLARVLNSSIHLLYVADVDEIPESNNPIVVNRMIDRLDRKAANCVESLREMIEESGVTVTTAESRVGKVETLILNYSNQIAPGLIILGKDSFAKAKINRVIDEVESPVLCVPQSAPPRLPISITLSSHQNILFDKAVDTLLKIIQGTTRELIMLNVVKRKRSSLTDQLSIVSARGNVVVSCHQHVDSELVSGVCNFVETNGVDFLGVTQKRQSFFGKLFRRNVIPDLLRSLTIPVMIIKV